MSWAFEASNPTRSDTPPPQGHTAYAFPTVPPIVDQAIKYMVLLGHSHSNNVPIHVEFIFH